jgi:hypothetical protein
MKTEDITKILDGLEVLMIMHIKHVLKTMLHHEVDDQGAKNILAKLGTRLAFEKELGKLKVDEIFTSK